MDSVSEADVVYMDYGNKERVKANKLRALPEKFTALPAQAICCALAEVFYDVYSNKSRNAAF